MRCLSRQLTRLNGDSGRKKCRDPVIVATGPFHHPRTPLFASALSPQVEQLHSASYHNPSQIPPGPVLVVGAGDSGAHIAAELAHSHSAFLAAAHPLYFVPITLFGKSLFWYLDHLRLLEVDGASRLGAWLKAQPEPVLGLELKQMLRERQVQIKPRATSAHDNVVQFADGSQAVNFGNKLVESCQLCW